MTEPDGRILLILDLDETLIHATRKPLSWAADFQIGLYSIYQRPGLADFLATCARGFRLAVWSTATDEYVQHAVAQIMPPGLIPAFAWGRTQCTRRYDAKLSEEYLVKDLVKVKRLGYTSERVLIVDDTPRKIEGHYGSALYVAPFHGEREDRTLPRLARYLSSIRHVPDVRALEKRD